MTFDDEGSVPTLALGGRGLPSPVAAERPEPVPRDDPQTGDTNERADDEVEIQQPDGTPAPRTR